MISTVLIEAINKAGMNVLKIYEDEHSAAPEIRFSWWITHSFDPAVMSGHVPVEFHLVKGIEVTDFFNTQHVFADNVNTFVQKLSEYVEERRVSTCKFHHNIRWKQYV